MTGVALIAAECLGSLQDVKRVLRALVGERHSAASWQHSSSGPTSTLPTICA